MLAVLVPVPAADVMPEVDDLLLNVVLRRARRLVGDWSQSLIDDRVDFVSNGPQAWSSEWSSAVHFDGDQRAEYRQQPNEQELCGPLVRWDFDFAPHGARGPNVQHDGNCRHRSQQENPCSHCRILYGGSSLQEDHYHYRTIFSPIFVRPNSMRYSTQIRYRQRSIRRSAPAPSSAQL